MWDRTVKALSLAAGFIAGCYGEWTAAMDILLIMMTVDYLSGVLVAAAGKSPKTEGGGLSSKIGFVGLARKGFIMLIVLVATQLDRATGSDAMAFRTAAVFYYIANEGLSILENAELMGVPFPKGLRERLEGVKNGGVKSE